MPQCAAFGCKKRTGKMGENSDISFHKFPKDIKLKEKWVLAIKREKWKPSAARVICSLHFKNEDFDKSSPFRTYLKKGAVPSVFPAFPKRLQTVAKICAPDIQLHTGCFDTTDKTAVNEIKNPNFEQIYIKEEPLEQSDHEVHDVIVNGIKKEECSDEDEKNCTGVFEIGAPLNKHKKIIDSDIEEFKCSVCQQMFTQKHNLENHIKTHHENKKFECFIGVCQQQFTNKFEFECHIETHDETNDEATKFQCFICNKLFRLKTNLKQHQQIHSGIKQYECYICKKSFSRNRDLKTHLKMHAGEKDFQCQICQKSFYLNSSLRRHIKQVHDEGREFRCNLCHKFYSREGNLLKHLKTHADRKYYQCDVCNKLFPQKPSLIRHVKTHRKKKFTVGPTVAETHTDVDVKVDILSDIKEEDSIKEEALSDFEYEELKLDIFKKEKCNNNEICDNYEGVHIKQEQ